ncbi:MAG: thioredoxin [Rhodobacteraceae bacterium]|nr:MAG: thioredoxin [Paracoccaceae bacterium]
MLKQIFAGILAATLTVGLGGPVVASELGDDGLYKAAWLRETFKDLQEDFTEADSEGRRLVLLVEQQGCIYCKEMHEVTFVDPRVKAMLEDVFYPVQIDLGGSREVTDTDGEELTEKNAVRKWGLMFTPTMIFLPAKMDPSLSVSQQAVAVMPGAFGPGTTLDMMTWVSEERYLTKDEEDFQRYHARMIRERNDGSTE